MAAAAAAAAVSTKRPWVCLRATVSCGNSVSGRPPQRLQQLQQRPMLQQLPQLQQWQMVQQNLQPPQQQQQQRQQRRFAKIVRWSPDTPLAHGLETFREAEDFFNACEQHRSKMKRRDWLAALSLLSTRRRIDFRSPSFRAFVAAALQQQELLQAPYIHLTIHRLGVIGYSPALWQLTLHLQPLLQQRQLSCKQLAVCAWGLAKNGVTHPPVWDLIGAEALRMARELRLTDLSMVLWAFARVERVKPAEILGLKEEVLSRLEAFVRQMLTAAVAPYRGAAAAAAAAPAAAPAASALPQPTPSLEDAHQDLTTTMHAEEEPSELVPSAAAAAAAAAADVVTSHDVCMLMRSFADLTPGDPSVIIRLLYTLLLTCRVPASVQAAAIPAAAAAAAPGLATAAAEGEDGEHRQIGAAIALGGPAPLTAQGLTAVWTALKDTKITKVFTVPLHKRPSGGSSSSSRHRAYLPFRETVPLECLPLLLPILKPAQVYSQGTPQAAGPAAAPATPQEAAAPQRAAAADAPLAARGGVAEHAAAAALGSTGEESSSVTVPSAAAAVAAAAKEGLRSNALLHSACTDVLLEVLCEETRLLRLDHTTNTSMVAALAEALADMQLVDPRLVYQLVLFAHQRGAAQFQGEQLLKVLEAFEDCQIADSKAWARLAHRAQDVAGDLDLKGLKKLRQLARRSGHSNARLEGVVDHFEALKEDVQRSLFGQIIAIGALPLSFSTAEGDSRTRRKHAGISKHINDRELRRLQLPSLLSALLPPVALLEDQGGHSSSSDSEALPVQQQALVIRGAASLVLQQWVLLAADALQLLRRLLQPEKHQHRRSNNNAENNQLLGRHQQQDHRRKRVRTAEVQREGEREDDGEEQHEDADEAAEAIWERTAHLQLQQQHQQGEEESQQRLKRLGSVFATHLQEAESSVRANRESAGQLLQRGAPDLFTACWATVATPLRSGGPRPGQQQQPQQQQQIGSHERLLAATGEAHAPGMSWRRWAFGGSDPHIPFPSAAAASSAAAAAAADKSVSAEAGEISGERVEDADVESADFADMWGPLPEEEQQECYEAQQQQYHQRQQGEGAEAAQDVYEGPKNARRKGGHGVQLDTSISRRTIRSSSSGRAFPTLFNSSITAASPRLCHAAKYLAVTTAEVYEMYAVHPVANLYGWLQQQLLLPGKKPAWNLLHSAAGAAAEGRSAAAGRPLNKLSSGSGPLHAAAAAQTSEAQQHSTGGGPWPRREWEGDFTLYTEAELQQQQQQQQQQESSSSKRRSGDLLGSGEYVEVLRGIFDSSSMQQRATQTRLTQMRRESEASSTSRLGSSRRASGITAPSSEASLEALAYGDFPEFEDCPTEFGDEQQQHDKQQYHQQQNHLPAHGTAVASLRLKQLLQQYALTHPDVSGHLFPSGASPPEQQQQQQQQQNESTIPLSRLLPRGRVDPRTACCTFSHLLLLHRHGSIILDQQPQTLPMSSNKPYPELFVHVTQQWGKGDAAAGVQQPDEELQSQHQGEEEQQTQWQQQQQQHDHQQPNGPRGDFRRTHDKEVTSTSSEHKQQEQAEQQRQQQRQVPTRGGLRPTGHTPGANGNCRAPRAP
ncbi:hypothetical protein, conserved [Eimeria brunetti]|uniref:RAP domain-containing protein n=1 Tax=Eimeria brunetti TaxID=51314 RepID=U6LP62_9EIME|nr:hypothetical protein, conserved [Eimeria brunetti]